MASVAKIETSAKEEKQHLFWEKVKNNGEFIAASSSGVLLFAAWLLEKNEIAPLYVVLYILAYIIGGFYKAKEGIEETIQDKKLNVELLMILAAIGSAIIGYWTEGAILILIFAFSGALETYTMNKSYKELSSLMELQPEEALKITANGEERVHVSQLQVGDHILVKPGERIPVDGKIATGVTTVDEAAITGESIPVEKGIQDDVFQGTVNLNGVVTIEVTKPSSETLFQKIIELVQSAQSEKSSSQLFIEKFEGIYVNIVLVVVAIMMVLPHYLFDWSWNETFYRAMILLVVASPCALVASITPAALSAISHGARKGILFKGATHLELLSQVRAIAFDKTGTLTKGKPEVTDVVIDEKEDQSEVLHAIASIERHSNHPLAHAIVTYAEKVINKEWKTIKDFTDVPGWGIEATVEGKKWKIGKAEFVGEEGAQQFLQRANQTLVEEGKSLVFVKREETIVGVIALKDQVREETKKAIEKLNELGIYTIMLTGDHEKTAEVIAEETKVKDFIANCLPKNKVDHIRKLKEKYKTVAMVGDGINDAPALATANVGISVGDGTDVALETADIVLMKNHLGRIYDAIQLSKRMNRIVKQNIVFSISVILLLILSNFMQILDLPLGVIGHEGSTILVILNGLRLLK